jgi:hypothetical protein
MKMDVLSKIGFDQQKDPERTAGTTQTFIINTLGFVCPTRWRPASGPRLAACTNRIKITESPPATPCG